MLEAPKYQRAVLLRLVSRRQKYTGYQSPLTRSTTIEDFLIAVIPFREIVSDLNLVGPHVEIKSAR